MGSVTLSANAPNPPYPAITLQIRPAIQDTGLKTFTITAKNGFVQSTASITLTTQKNAQWTTVKAPTEVRWYAKPELRKDPEGNICFASYSYSHSKSDSISVHHYINQQWETKSFSPTLSLYEFENVKFSYGKNGVLWFGTQNGLGKYDGNFTSIYNTSNSVFPFNYVRSVENDKNGLPVCFVSDREQDTPNLAMVSFDGTTWKSITAPKSKTGHSADWSSSFCIDSSNRIWIPASGKGIVRIKDSFLDSITSQNNPPLASNYVSQVLCDKDGEMWCMYSSAPNVSFSHFNGIVWQHVSSPTTASLNNFLIDDKKNIWVGSEEGLHRYDGVAWTTYSKTNSPLPGGVKKIIQDKDKNIWIYINQIGGSFPPFYVFNPTGLVGIPIAPPSDVEEQTIQANGIQIYPNPTSSSFMISGAEGGSAIRVINSLGVEVISRNETSGKAQIDASSLSNGLYFVNIRTVTGDIVKPIIVIH